MGNDAYIIIKQNEYLRKFRRAGATDPNLARTLSEIGVKPSGIFRRMEDRDVFRQGRRPETYYIDESAAEDFLAARRRRALYSILLAIALVALLFFLRHR
ncbi:MAG TPA: hypothetical protein P5119_08110 [Candidatus Aminicenantes bacterium]|nr:hypothetical protein [Candidatus Aminicenantes bacterium]HRY65290.1 hypothetical protein [Candidatus Aminicenantes bacterium]HRZ72242.1 hypothetical protein [Candidatus Aminicenantes bacterium]